MRPRPDAAENFGLARPAAGRGRASMRPRPDAAENGARGASGSPGAAASMRPRPDAAENLDDTATDFDRAARLQ